jgi:hypothetical protein
MNANLIEIIGDAHDIMLPGSVLKLCGKEGKDIIEKFKMNQFESEIMKYKNVIQFLTVNFLILK